MSNDRVGSLALQPKRQRVWGDDQTSTQMRKTIVSSMGIDLRADRAESMRRHKRLRAAVRLALLWLALGVGALLVRWLIRVLV